MADRAESEEFAQHSHRDAMFGIVPLVRKERIFGFLDMTFVLSALAIATWAFLTGGDMAFFVGFEAGVAAMVLGFAIAIFFVIISLLPNTKWGLEHFVFLRSIFGRHGVKPLIYIVNFLIIIGWMGILAIMFGRAATNVVNVLVGTGYGGDHIVVVLFGLLALVISWLVVVKGPVALKWMNRIAAPGLFVVIIVMLVFLFAENSYSDLAVIQPLEPFGNKIVDFMMVVEFNAAAALSWWVALGNTTRFGKSQRGCAWAQVIGFFVVGMVAQAVGFIAALSYGDADPTAWMIPLTGSTVGVLILVWIGFANITSISVSSYMTLVALRQEGVRWLANANWGVLAAVFLGLSALLLIRPSAVYDNFFQFLLWLGLVYAPLVGLVVFDYYILRRQQIDMRALFDTRKGSPYDFWGGWNIGAYICVGIGVVTYLLLLNPISLWYSAPFPYLTATVPSLIIPGIAYLLMVRFWLRRVGRGGYAIPAGAVASPSPVKAGVGS
ncbi:MAG: cytosine permease [Candidatus Eisenbacteria bacterium]|nr:cytosine permease [Candidatus Eisenbacteria bacterium]